MKKSTDELLKILKHTLDLNNYLKEEQENILSSSLHEHLMQLTMKKNISMAQCIKEAGIDRTMAIRFSPEPKPLPEIR